MNRSQDNQSPDGNDRQAEVEQRLARLATVLEEQLSNGSDGDDLLSSQELTHEQMAELQRARRALGFLRAAQQDMRLKQAMVHAESDSLTIAHDSTHHEITASGPDTGDVEVANQIGRFQLREVLGQGGYARVFLAHDPQLDRLVALKVPLPKMLVDPGARKRFEREARAAAILSHPAIVPIYESGSTGPISYIAFGYCPGQNLSEWFVAKQRKVSHRSAAAILARMAEATEHAHQRGIVHRDLKPANVLLELISGEADLPDDERIAATVRISDFGLAQLDSNAGETLTVEGAVVGTPAYMSPEQARGEHEVGVESDIFSLGTILYELLTGTLPFRRDNHLATLKAIESVEPTSLRKLDPGISRDLESVCLKCLQKSPEDRYTSAHELADDLNCWLGNRPVKARPMTSLEKVRRGAEGILPWALQ